jgi:hypothetical protein
MSLCELWAKLKALVTGRRRLHDLQEEIDAHLAMEIEDV